MTESFLFHSDTAKNEMPGRNCERVSYFQNISESEIKHKSEILNRNSEIISLSYKYPLSCGPFLCNQGHNQPQIRFQFQSQRISARRFF